MTRINLVDPRQLSDQHLIAEYREIFMVGSALRRSLNSPNWEKTKKTLPEKFTLNLGHVKLFYDKGKYLHKRYEEIVLEMKTNPENNLSLETGKRKHLPFEDESSISSFIEHNLTPTRESLLSNLIANFPESLSSLFPLLATSFNLFFLTIPFFVVNITK